MPASMMDARSRARGILEQWCVVRVDLDAMLRLEAVRPVDCVSDRFDAVQATHNGERYEWVGEGAPPGPVTYVERCVFRAI